MEHKSRFLMLMIWAMSFSPSSLENGGEGGGIFLTLPEHIPQNRTASNFRRKFETCKQNFIRNILPHSNLKSEISVFDDCLFFFLTFCCYFRYFFPNSINYVIKAKYILLELKAPWLMSTISETYNNILELASILQNASFKTSKVERDYY